MLVLSRELHETIKIGDDITITICRVNPFGQVRIGIDAPPSVVIMRGELERKPVESEVEK